MKKRKLKLSLNKKTISKLQDNQMAGLRGGGPEISEQVCTNNCPSHQQTNCDTDVCNVTQNNCPDPPALF